jgi:hypothetical protein
VTFSSCALAALALQVLHSAKITNTFVNLSKKFMRARFTVFLGNPDPKNVVQKIDPHNFPDLWRFFLFESSDPIHNCD